MCVILEYVYIYISHPHSNIILLQLFNPRIRLYC